MNIRKLKITLDTNLIFEFWKNGPKKEIIEKLISISNSEKIHLAITARIRDDVPCDPLASKINKLNELNISEIGSITRLGYWALGRDCLGEKYFSDFIDVIKKDSEFSKIKNPPNWKDFDHLHAHYLNKRDIFLTWDKGIHHFKNILKKYFDLIIMTPEEFLREFYPEKLLAGV